ncbi:hypothetical protein KJ966_24910 [bacterium]|nr:hypothetical protein [bacterium]
MNQEKIKTGIWSAIGGAVVTMIVGFSMGGWVLGSTSLDSGKKMAQSAVIERLTPMCVAQFNQDLEKEKKLVEFRNIDFWKKEQYIMDQGWATMPFEAEPDTQIADSCSTSLMKNGQ